MTWTQIDPDRLSKYEGMSPSDIGRAVISNSEYYTTEFMLRQELAHSPNTEPYRHKIDNAGWMEFWKPVYDLENKPKDTWTLDEWFAYRGLTNVISYALIAMA